MDDSSTKQTYRNILIRFIIKYNYLLLSIINKLSLFTYDRFDKNIATFLLGCIYADLDVRLAMLYICSVIGIFFYRSALAYPIILYS